MKILLVVLLVSALGAVVGWLVLRRRMRRIADASAESRTAKARRLADGRLTAEADYVLSRIDQELLRLEDAGREASGPLHRLRELRAILAQTYSLEPKPFPVSGPCAEVIDAFRVRAGERDLLYSESGDGRWLQVMGDRQLVRWAVLELFANTMAHAGNWSRLALLAEPSRGAIVLTVRDDGVGLDAMATARLYAPFTPRVGSQGPGLGLYLVRRIVEAMGGTTEARSVPGGGLLHKLRLPHPPEGAYGHTVKPVARVGAHSQ